jgi:ABC-type Fe3+-hydroxamate transport system substrate-binding protein
MRVVSLVPSVTETLLSWGVKPVACTRFCEQPALRHVGGTKDPDIDAVVKLAPDLVVMDEEENRQDDAAELRSRGLAVHVTAVRSVGDVADALEGLAAAVGARFDSAASSVEPLLNGLRVFVPIWKRPWMTINDDTYGASLLAALGAVNVFADGPKRYPVVTLEEAKAAKPQVVLAPSEPYPFGPRHVPDLEEVAPVMLVDGQDLFWWGVRTPAAAERLGRYLSTGYLNTERSPSRSASMIRR